MLVTLELEYTSCKCTYVCTQVPQGWDWGKGKQGETCFLVPQSCERRESETHTQAITIPTAHVLSYHLVTLSSCERERSFGSHKKVEAHSDFQLKQPTTTSVANRHATTAPDALARRRRHGPASHNLSTEVRAIGEMLRTYAEPKHPNHKTSISAQNKPNG
jgi:hypothetical protein